MHSCRPTQAAPGFAQHSSFHKREDLVCMHKRPSMACDKWGQAGQGYAFLNLTPLYRAISPRLIIQTSESNSTLPITTSASRIYFAGNSQLVFHLQSEIALTKPLVALIHFPEIWYCSTFNSLWVTDLFGNLMNPMNPLPRKLIHIPCRKSRNLLQLNPKPTGSADPRLRTAEHLLSFCNNFSL